MVEKVEKYKTIDGEMFDTREEADRHEVSVRFKPLEGMCAEDIANIINGKNGPGREAFMLLNREVQKYRDANGEVRRRAKKDESPEPLKKVA